MSFIGNALLVLTAATTLFGLVAFLIGARNRQDRVILQARRATFLAAGFITLAVTFLLVAFLSHDFSLKYVYSESARETPFIYLVSALWAGNAGSLLFWGWLVAVAGAVLLWRGKVQKNIMAYALPVILITETFFLILIFLQNPFTRLLPAPSDGLGMNPLLQNLGMVFHPPTLLIGWALLLVPFAIAIGAMITRRLDNEWLSSARRWALASWIFLGVGNLLGAWWAYYELGWGGYWAWDPVENAGLMPWLLVTAFLHSTMMQRRRGFNKLWNMLLIVFAFLLTIFGAYLTRSDILSSVHTFGATPAEPVFIVFMVIALVGAVWLIIARRKDLKDEPGDDALVSGETTFFVNNLLLVTATLAIFIGTMFPFFSRILTGNQIEQDAHFFNSVTVPVFLSIILLAGLCVLIGFKKPNLTHFGRALMWPAVGALVLTIALLILGITKWYALVALFIIAFALFATTTKWARDIPQNRSSRHESALKTLRRLFSGNRARYGGYIVHFAIIVIGIGIIGSSVYDVHIDDIVMTPGQSVTVQSYTLTYNGYSTSGTETSMTLTANVDLKRGDTLIGSLHPQLVYNGLRDSTVAEAAVRSTLIDDVYVSIYDADAEQNAGFTILVNPLVNWIWIGGAILLLGSVWAFGAAAKQKPAADD